jgi:hypothetical protein
MGQDCPNANKKTQNLYFPPAMTSNQFLPVKICVSLIIMR